MKPLSILFAATIGLVACVPSLQSAYESYSKTKAAGQVVVDVVCALPEDSAVRGRIRTGFAEISLNSSEICNGAGLLSVLGAPPPAASAPAPLHLHHSKVQDAGAIALDVLCALPVNGVVRPKLRTAFANIGLDSRDVCDKGLASLFGPPL